MKWVLSTSQTFPLPFFHSDSQDAELPRAGERRPPAEATGLRVPKLAEGTGQQGSGSRACVGSEATGSGRLGVEGSGGGPSYEVEGARTRGSHRAAGPP